MRIDVGAAHVPSLDAVVDISLNELDEECLDAVRYRNVHQAMGTLPLAVRPQAIAAVLQLLIPVADPSLESEADAGLAASDALVMVTRALNETEPEASFDTRTHRVMQSAFVLALEE